MAAGHAADAFHHVRDFPYFELPFGIHLRLPEIAFLPSPSKLIASWQGTLPPGESVWGVQLTKFMVLQLVAALFVFVVFRSLAKSVGSGKPAKGRWANFWEMLAVYIRDAVVRPTIGTGHPGHGDEGEHAAAPHGGHPADQYVPFVWSMFFYILLCNLLGAFPWLGSPTGEINVTGALALVAMGGVILAGSQVSGVGGFWKSLVPGMDLPPVTKAVLWPALWVIEVAGFFIRHGVLAVRLFANMMAGHTVLGVVLGFIAISAHSGAMFYIVAPSSVFGQVALGLLELFVAFLQAYIFAFLATVFLSAVVHPH